MKNIISVAIVLCWSSLLVSAEVCLDPATLNPTAIHATVKLFQNIRTAENLIVSVDKNHYQYECKHSKLGKTLSKLSLGGYITQQYFLDDKIIVTYNDSNMYEIKKDQQHVTYTIPLGYGSYQNGNCSGVESYYQNRTVSLVEFINVTLSINNKTLEKESDASYIFSDVRVYTLSKHPLVQYALLGYEDYFLALHLKEPYNMTSSYINTDYNSIIKFGEHDDGSRNNRTAQVFLKMYGTFPERALKLMKDHCEIIVFQEILNAERGTLQKKVDQIFVVFYGICLILSGLLHYWMLRKFWMAKSDIKKIEKSVAILSLTSQMRKSAEGPYEYIEFLDTKKDSEYGYDTVTLTSSKNGKKKERTSGYLTPVNSQRRKTNNYVNLQEANCKNIDNKQTV
ncbi:uncharacterized protein LOC108914211 [Anoplophora glabripennis]|uniref:uncharacterized protein LOC108914211 n=1 Tax=Anoplophora glabripennis TaxID=217634 RepID=UPI000873EEA1|nr:uncharacterized protein LOC108914211 [Anoplophora glabripennis]